VTIVLSNVIECANNFEPAKKFIFGYCQILFFVFQADSEQCSGMMASGNGNYLSPMNFAPYGFDFKTHVKENN